MKIDFDLMTRKLEDLCDAEGCPDSFEFMNQFSMESVVPGICLRDDCSYTTGVEPDQRQGYCEECQGQTVMSGVELWFEIQ